MSLLSYFIKPSNADNSGNDSKNNNLRLEPRDNNYKLQQNISSVMPSTGVAAVDQKFIDHFTQVMAKSNQDGPDFFEFMQSLTNMQNLGLSEDKAYLAAWGGFEAIARNTDISVLNTSAQKYIEVLQKDKTDFNNEVQNALVNDIGDLKKKIADMEAQNKDAAGQIAKLQNTIQANNDNIAKVNGQISEKTVKINNGKNSYAVTFDAFLGKINDTLNKINTYLGGTQ